MSDTASDTNRRLTSFGKEIRAVVIGATGGLGNAFANSLAHDPDVSTLHCFARQTASGPEPIHPLDLEDEQSIAEAAETVREAVGSVHLVLVATGMLHDGALQPEKTWRQLSADRFDKSFKINAVGPALVAKHFLPLLARDRKAAFAAISARVGSIGDNRLGGWYAYRASKAALNMILRSLSIELARKNKLALCIGLHPGTVDTALSEPFQGNVPDGKLFTPERSALAMLSVLDGLSADDTGHLFAWDGTRIPF
ncbi:MAG: SDR family NAD(P)-dependent oxidoreductase [Pseudomonadota bacterium]